MKRHYIYFAILPVLLVLACMTPMSIWEYDGERTVYNAFDEPTAFIFLIPALVATIFLMVKNYITAILGTLIYLGATGLAMFMVYVLTDRNYNDSLGPAPFFILVSLMIASIVSTIHSVKLTKNRPIRPRNKESEDLLDI